MEYVECQGVRIPRPHSYADSLKLIGADFYRVLGRTVSNPLRLWLLHFRMPAMGFLFYYRLCKHRRGWAYPYFRLRMEKYVRKYALQIPLAAEVGQGLYLGHGVSVIVNGSAVVNRDVPAGAVAAGVPARVVRDKAGYAPANPSPALL